jgi:hypothetical protein
MQFVFVWSKPDQIDDYRSFINGMVEPDYKAFLRDESDLRLGLHSAMSLFHLSEWLYHPNKPYIDANFQWLENGVPRPVTTPSLFANALADQHENFELVRSVANASKHLMIGAPVTRQVPQNRATHAANTYVEYHSSWFGWQQRGVVTIEGPNNQNVRLGDVLTDVRQWWSTVLNQHGWA